MNIVSPGGFFNNQEKIFLDRYNARTFLGRMANEQDIKGACAGPPKLKGQIQ